MQTSTNTLGTSSHMIKQKRRAVSPLKQNPIHFKHGDRNLKNCLLCEASASKAHHKPTDHAHSVKKEEKIEEMKRVSLLTAATKDLHLAKEGESNL